MTPEQGFILGLVLGGTVGAGGAIVLVWFFQEAQRRRRRP